MEFVKETRQIERVGERHQQHGDEAYSELVGIGLHRAQVGALSLFEINASTGILKPNDVSIRLNGKKS